MGRVETAFETLRASGRTGLMPFVVGGYPDLESFGQVLSALDANGANVIEVGIPFSDPIADGPVIASAMHLVLEQGIGPREVLERVRAVRGHVDAALVAMVSASVVHRLGGPVGFCETAAGAGFDGLIVPDAPLESSAAIADAARAAGLTLSLLVSPSTPPDRAAQIAGRSTGFVYLLARAGITGERSDAPDIAATVSVLRDCTDLPIACGFGVSTPEHVAAVTEHADAAIVGTALVRRLTEADGDLAAIAGDFCAELASGLTERGPTSASEPQESGQET